MWCSRILAALGLTLLVVTTTARLTLLDADFDARAIDASNGYERVYTEVLPAPAAQRVIRRATGGLPLDPSYVTTNIRVLVPPPVLEAVVKRVLSQYVDVVLGRSQRVDVGQALQPIVNNIVRLAQELASGTVATATPSYAPSLSSFETQVSRLFTDLAEGRLHPRLPTITVKARDVHRVARILTAGLPPDASEGLRRRLVPLLASGDLSGAFALVVPAYLNDAVVHEIATTAASSAQQALDSVRRGVAQAEPRTVLPLPLGWLTALGVLLTAAGVVALRQAAGQRTREVMAILGCAAGLAIIAGALLSVTLVDPLRSATAHPGLDPALRRLVIDVDEQLRRGVTRTFLMLTALLAGAASALWLLEQSRSRVLWRRRTAITALVAVVLGAPSVAAVSALSGHRPLYCNGSPRLCDRPYNQVTYLTSHNAMASSDRGFLGASQDPTITSQLDNGVRGLMLDLHYWTTPSQAARYLATLDEKESSALAPWVKRFQARPGVWFCHELCQLGADRAVTQLRALRAWLAEHPNDVVTLILQDDVSPADVTATISAAGLDPWLVTPPEPGQPWPTLAEMIHRHRTLVVFTQNAELDEGPIRNFYERAAETPYEAHTIGDLRCSPGRGPALAPLFLVNNWIGKGLPTRADALAVNDPGFLLPRVRRCQRQRGLRATYVAVDFAQVGYPLQAVNELNAL